MLDSIKLWIDGGLPSYDLCPNAGTDSDAAYLNFTPSVSLKADASLNKGGAYVYVATGNDNAFKCAQLIRYMHEQGKGVKVGLTWYGSFNQARKGGIVPVTPPSGSTGGHDMLCVAWREINGHQYLGFRNSWGETWGDKGRIWIPVAHIRGITGIGVLPPEQVVVPPKVENRDYYLEVHKASDLRKVLYEKFPLDVNSKAQAAKTVARSWAGRNWLVLVQAVCYRGWSNTDVINFLYALSRGKKDTKAYSFDFNKYK
jgi:hypothetical protein